MPKISVIMPVYNTKPKHLEQAIVSVLSQTFIDFEFLILNDSPDNNVLDNMVASFDDKRIKYIKPEHNLGIAEAHNALLREAKGQYIAVMDHDDVSLPMRLHLLKRKTIYHPENHEQIQASLLFNCPIHHPSVMIRKKILEEFNITYDKRFISLNDRKLYLDISKHAKLHNLQDVLYKYRIHPMMTSKVRRQEIMNEQLEYRETLLTQYGVNFSEEEKQILNSYVFNGRCHIKSVAVLDKIRSVLEKLEQGNKSTGFSNNEAFQDICSTYLIKRCKNAALKGLVSSKRILNKTTLPVEVPVWLSLFNRIRER